MELDPNLVTLATGVGIAIAAAVAYMRKPPGSPPAAPDDSTVIVGGSLSDRASMRLLADACNRIAAAIESHDATVKREQEHAIETARLEKQIEERLRNEARRKRGAHAPEGDA